MQVCIDLAKKGLPNAFPNPLVGCILVHEGEILGQGYHQYYGQAHAEVNAIASVINPSLIKNSTLYVNLEPCAHFGKTPPCSKLIIEKGIKKVVIGALDTFSKVNGKGIENLRKAGVQVKSSVLEMECRKLNKRFFTFHEKKRPYIILKWAKSNDGFLAPNNQKEPFWMTGDEAKKRVHKWRSRESAILVGTNTVLIDNPRLTTRDFIGKNPIRIILDRSLRIPKHLNIYNSEATTLIVNEKYSDKNHIKVDFEHLVRDLLQQLYQRNIKSLIVEGGAQTLNAFIHSNNWDEARVFKTKMNLYKGVQAPVFEHNISKIENIGDDQLSYFYNT